MKPEHLKLLASSCAVILIASFFLYVTRKIPAGAFWSIAIITGIVAYKGIPYLAR